MLIHNDRLLNALLFVALGLAAWAMLTALAVWL